MDSPIRILFRGSRTWNDRKTIRDALEYELRGMPMSVPVVLVHGGCTAGAERQADDAWSNWSSRWPTLFEPIERHHVQSFPSPEHHSRHMVSLGAHLCMVASTNWHDDAAYCGRAARVAGIRTVDLGVPTSLKNRPVAAA